MQIGDEEYEQKKKDFFDFLFPDVDKIEDGHKTKFLYEKYSMFCYVSVLFEATTILITISYYEYSRTSQKDLYQEILMSLLLANSFSSIGVILLKNYYNMKYLESSRRMNRSYGIMDSKTSYFMPILDILTCFLVPNWFFKDRYWISRNYETGITYNVYWNDAMCSLAIIRVIPLVHGLIVNTGYHSIRMQRLSRMLGFKADQSFAIKCLLKNHPITMLFVSFCGSVFIFAYTIRVCEIPLRSITNDVDWENYAQVYWFVIVTMTTVGYGDSFPLTLPGRMVSFLLCVWGVFLVSLVVLTLFELLQLTEEEKLALQVYRRGELKVELKETSAEVLQSMFRLILNIKKGKKSSVSMKRAAIKYKEQANLARELAIQMSSYSEYDLPFYDLIVRHVTKLSKNVNVIGWRQEKLLEHCDVLEEKLKDPTILQDHDEDE